MNAVKQILKGLSSQLDALPRAVSTLCRKLAAVKPIVVTASDLPPCPEEPASSLDVLSSSPSFPALAANAPVQQPFELDNVGRTPKGTETSQEEAMIRAIDDKVLRSLIVLGNVCEVVRCKLATNGP